MQYVWVILLFLPSALSQSTGKFKVVVPDAPVFSVSGSDVVLPCSVQELHSQNIMVNAVDMNVTWSRPDIKDSLVHFYGNHKDLNTGQNPFYRKRTTMFKEELKNGNVSLKLFNVHPSDEGEYTCRVESSQWEDELSFKLSVEVVGSEPVITVEEYDSESGKFSLLCESKGWHPEPELQWRNSKDVNLTAETETQAVSGLFNVKSRITEEIDSFFCTVTQRVHVKKGRIDAQTLHKHVPSEAGKIVAITIGVLLLVGVPAGVVFYVYNERRKRQEERRKRQEEKRKREEEINEEKRKREEEINEVTSLLNSDRDRRLKYHDLSPPQWDYVECTLLKSKEERKEFILRKFDPSDRGVQKLKKVIESSEKALLKDCNLTEESCEVLASVLQSENSLEELNLSENKLRDSGVYYLCDGLKNENCKLKILRLEDCDLTGESCEYLAPVLQSENSKLTELNLSQNKLQESGLYYLWDGLKDENCKLKILRLEDCDLTEKSFEHLAFVLKSWNSKLIELNLSHNKGLKDSGVNILCKGLKLKDKSSKLEKLRLEDCGLREYSCITLANVLKSGKSELKELNLNKNRLQDSGVKNLCVGLTNEHCKLEILRLVDCDLTGKSCEYLAPVLQSDSKLIELNLSENIDLKDFGVEKLCDGLKDKNCKLEKLRLEYCDLTEVGCEYLANVLKSEKSKLIELDLSIHARLEDLEDLGHSKHLGVNNLCDGLKDENCKLQILRLYGCGVTNEGFSALASALIGNPSSHLEELDLSGNGLKESEQELLPELKDTLPKLKVIF